jgi:hypothetical protein
VSADTVEKYAPALFLRKDEKHYPATPEEFRRVGRLRQSNFDGRKDRGWNRAKQVWEQPGGKGPDYQGEEWETIKGLILTATGDLRPGGAAASTPETPAPKVARPRDSSNLWGRGETKGFFLELPDGYGRATSGPGSQVPIFHDVQRFRASNGSNWVAVYYWFFYVYNWFIVSEHEGDWEHVTLYFEPERFDAGDRPGFVYYAAHNDGLLLRAGDARIEWYGEEGQAAPEGTHPGVYVSPFGHPSYPTVPEKLRALYPRPWLTWKEPLPSVQGQAWDLYDGAWGEIGEIVHSTGPLGPIFKRVDELTVRKEGL